MRSGTRKMQTKVNKTMKLRVKGSLALKARPKEKVKRIGIVNSIKTKTIDKMIKTGAERRAWDK
jgi:hypothetical protein